MLTPSFVEEKRVSPKAFARLWAGFNWQSVSIFLGDLRFSCKNQTPTNQFEEYIMAFSTISHWNTTEWTDALEAIARDKFVPLIMSVGASRVQMVRTGDNSFSVITEYADAKAADAAQTKIAEIRAQATEELPMSMESVQSGAVFAKS